MKVLCGLAVISMLGRGQDAPPKEVQKMIRLKYVDANRVRGLLADYAEPLHVGNWNMVTNVRTDDNLHMLVISGPEQRVAAYEEAVKKLDVPPLDFELTVYLLSSSAQAGDQLPDALASTAKQLHGVFAYKGYQLLDSFVLRGRDGQRGAASGMILKDSRSVGYTFWFSKASVSGEAPRLVSLYSLRLGVPRRTVNKAGEPVSESDELLFTDVDAREGQKIVVGKSDMNGGESPLILVVTAKVVE